MLHSPTPQEVGWCSKVQLPFSNDEDPAFFYSWGGHGTQCGVPVRPFSRSAFCAALGGRDVLLVGDSTQGTLHDAILGALDGTLPTTAQCVRYACTGHRVCGEEAFFTEHLPLGDARRVEPATLLFVPNFNLTLRGEYEAYDGPDPAHSVQPWLHLVTNNTVLILNRGAHYTPTPRLLVDLADTFARVRAHAPGAGIIFRNTPTGHMNVTRYKRSRPLRKRLAKNVSPPAWHWLEIDAQQEAVQALVADFSTRAGGDVIHLDVASQTALRADHHNDPLHYCTPGPVDHWVALIQAVLTAPRDIGLVRNRSVAEAAWAWRSITTSR